MVVLSCFFPFRHADGQYNIPENRIWAFGIFAGLDFNSGSPVPIRTAVSGAPYSNGHTGQASVAVSDRNGQLLFYTNGSHVWDRLHNLILPSPLHPGALNLTPVTQVTTQGTLVVPVPGNQNQYYIFSLTHPGNHAPQSVALYGKLYYSLFDIQLNGGMGGIVPGQQWQLMASDLADKMIAVPGAHCNVWLLVHSIEMNRFLAFEINASGINTNPVISTVGSSGSIPAAGGRNQYWIDGQMAISHDFRKLAIAATMGSFAELFDFDPSTGIVSNPFMLDTGVASFGLAFSPDNSKLYLVAQEEGTPSYAWHLFQYDMNAGSQIAIRLSKTKVSTNFMPRTQLKLGPDNRIYFGNNMNTNGFPTERGRRLGALLAPNQSGAASNFIPEALNLLDSTSMIYGLSHEVTRVRDSVFSKTVVNRCQQTEVITAPSGYDFYEWYDGSSSPSITVREEGTYWVRGKKGCVVYVDTFEVRNSVSVSLGPDTVVCHDPKPITLRPNTDRQIEQYLWSDGSMGRTLIARRSGKYWVSIVTREGCVASDTIDIVLTDLTPQLGDDTIICGAPQVITLEVEVSESTSVLWSDGSMGRSMDVNASGVYWVALREDRCEMRDTISITFLELQPTLGADTMLCNDDPISLILSLEGLSEGSRVLWSDGSEGTSLTVQDTGSYWVEVQLYHCLARDSIVIQSHYCDCAVMFPSAFTPNGDGLNDYFRPVVSAECPVREAYIGIYNRWGELVFQTNDFLTGWDGVYHGLPAEQGVYMFRAELTVGAEAHQKQFKGDLMLIR